MAKAIWNRFDMIVDGEVNSGAAWYYSHPKSAVKTIKDRVAFWKGCVGQEK